MPSRRPDSIPALALSCAILIVLFFKTWVTPSSVQASGRAVASPAFPVTAFTQRHGGRTVAGVVADLETSVGSRVKGAFAAARRTWPPRRISLLAFKRERRLEVWDDTGPLPVLIRAVPVLAASGGPGPKLRRGDLQVPEGVYRIEGLNPNSAYHLSLRLDYPGARDRRAAAREGRRDLGGDIYIHGDEVSAGCLALGDPGIEEVFYLVAHVPPSGRRVVIAPFDVRAGSTEDSAVGAVSWPAGYPDDLAEDLEAALAGYQRPAEASSASE